MLMVDIMYQLWKKEMFTQIYSDSFPEHTAVTGPLLWELWHYS